MQPVPAPSVSLVSIVWDFCPVFVCFLNGVITSISPPTITTLFSVLPLHIFLTMFNKCLSLSRYLDIPSVEVKFGIQFAFII